MDWIRKHARRQFDLSVPRLKRRRQRGLDMSLRGMATDFYRKFNEDNVLSLAASFAYRMIFAVPAIIILTFTIAAVIDQATSIDVASRLRDLISNHAPADTKVLLNSIVDNAIAKAGAGKASVGIVVTAAIALWSASSGIGALVDSFNRAYEVRESRPFLHKRLTLLGLTLLLTLAVNLAFVLLVYGSRIGHALVDRWGMGSQFDSIPSIIRWPIAVGSMMVMLSILYYVGPNVEISFRWISPGSMSATVLWLLATAGFGIYLRFGNPGSAYGALGSMLVFLLYLYITGAIFILGAELNAVLGARYDPATVEDLATTPDASVEARQKAQQQLRKVS